MKKIIGSLMAVVMILAVTVPVFGQDETPDIEPTATAQLGEDIYTFPILGFSESRLIGPFDSTGIQVSFPEEWTYPTGGSIHLDFNLAFQGDDYVEGQALDGGVLDVSVNDTIIETISLRQAGDYSMDIDIPASAMVSERTDGRMSFDFDLISEESCTWDFDINVIIRESSYLYLPHSLTSPSIDLTALPRPFYQPSSLFERKAILVLPDNPSMAELQAGMDVAAGFGSLTSGNLLMEFVTEEELSATQKNDENLIFVGKSASLSLLAGLGLPLNLENDAFTMEDENDGIMQMAISPWNDSKAVLVVSGNTDEGVIKAGQALKYGTILTTSLNNVAEIADYRTEASSPLVDTDRTFLELGYADKNLRSSGTNYAYFDFYIPPGQTVSDEAYLELHFNHSSLINFNTSGLTATLNGRVIGSVSFTEETTQLSIIEMTLPPSAFIQGTNNLLVQVQLIPYDSCTDLTNFISTWATIFSDSNLHLPLVTDTTSIEDELALSAYPDNLIAGEAAGNVTFILPENDPASWKSAAQIAFEMGDQLDESLAQISVQYQNSLNEEELAEQNVVLIGIPAQLPLIYEWSSILPAPFESGSSVPYDPASRVVYRVVEGTDVGYIELLISPWGTEKIAMLVSGNNQNGLALASSALADGDFRGSLAGNFAIVSSGQIVSLDTRFPVSSELLDAQMDEIAETAAQTEPSQIQQQNLTWMIPAVIIISLLTIGVILLKLLPALRGSTEEDTED